MSRTSVLSIAVSTLVAFTTGVAIGETAATTEPAAVGFSAKRLDRVDEALEGYVDRKDVAGVVGLIARSGNVVYHKSFGFRDVEAQDPMSSDVIFRIASMTKPITSVGLMQLWEQGRFQLRDPLSKFLPEFAKMRVALPIEPSDTARGPFKTVEAASQITIQQLLTHTAGFANPYRGATQDLYREVRANLKPGSTVGDYVTELANLPLNFHPGERWEYGPATDVAGRLIEVLSGLTLDEYPGWNIFEPLGMADTHV